jgi:hypothetical protein
MKRILLAIAAGIAATPRFAACADAQLKELRLVPKDAFVKSIAPSPRAPFSLKAEHAPGVELMPRRLEESRVEERRHAPSSCEAQHALCYDAANGRIVYKPARSLMPEIPGFQRENISIKRNRIIFRYTF